MYRDIEKVTVNGMTMWKWGNQLFLCEEDAKKVIRESKINKNALRYGYIIDGYDPVELILAGEILKGIKL